jgi:hypothetical protein
MRFLDRFRRRVKVEITCPHGQFIPGTYQPGAAPSRYACRDCGFRVQVSTIRGEASW